MSQQARTTASKQPSKMTVGDLSAKLGWSKIDVAPLYGFLCEPSVLKPFVDYHKKRLANTTGGNRGAATRKAIAKATKQAIEGQVAKFMGLISSTDVWSKKDMDVWFTIQLFNTCRSQNGIWAARGNEELQAMCEDATDIMMVVKRLFQPIYIQRSDLVKEMVRAATNQGLTLDVGFDVPATRPRRLNGTLSSASSAPQPSTSSTRSLKRTASGSSKNLGLGGSSYGFEQSELSSPAGISGLGAPFLPPTKSTNQLPSNCFASQLPPFGVSGCENNEDRNLCSAGGTQDRSVGEMATITPAANRVQVSDSNRAHSPWPALPHTSPTSVFEHLFNKFKDAYNYEGSLQYFRSCVVTMFDILMREGEGANTPPAYLDKYIFLQTAFKKRLEGTLAWGRPHPGPYLRWLEGQEVELGKEVLSWDLVMEVSTTEEGQEYLAFYTGVLRKYREFVERERE